MPPLKVVTIIALIAIGCSFVTAKDPIVLTRDDPILTAFDRYLVYINAVSECDDLIRSWSCGWCQQGTKVIISPQSVSHIEVFRDETKEDKAMVVFDMELKEVVVVVRGTSNAPNSDSDMDIVLEDYPGNAFNSCQTEGTPQVHRGYHNVFLSLPQVVPYVQELMSNTTLGAERVVVAGHSMGGGVANIFAVELAFRYPSKVHLYTTGAPRTFNLFAANCASDMLPVAYRMVNLMDMVPHSVVEDFRCRKPFGSSPSGYHHVGREVWRFASLTNEQSNLVADDDGNNGCGSRPDLQYALCETEDPLCSNQFWNQSQIAMAGPLAIFAGLATCDKRSIQAVYPQHHLTYMGFSTLPQSCNFTSCVAVPGCPSDPHDKGKTIIPCVTATVPTPPTSASSDDRNSEEDGDFELYLDQESNGNSDNNAYLNEESSHTNDNDEDREGESDNDLYESSLDDRGSEPARSPRGI